MAKFKSCDFLLPRIDATVCGSDEICECNLEFDHKGPHLTRNSSGQWFWWEPEENCEDRNNPESECFDHCECFTSWPATAKELAENLSKIQPQT